MHCTLPWASWCQAHAAAQLTWCCMLTVLWLLSHTPRLPALHPCCWRAVIGASAARRHSSQWGHSDANSFDECFLIALHSAPLPHYHPPTTTTTTTSTAAHCVSIFSACVPHWHTVCVCVCVCLCTHGRECVFSVTAWASVDVHWFHRVSFACCCASAVSVLAVLDMKHVKMKGSQLKTVVSRTISLITAWARVYAGGTDRQLFFPWIPSWWYSFVLFQLRVRKRNDVNSSQFSVLFFSPFTQDDLNTFRQKARHAVTEHLLIQKIRWKCGPKLRHVLSWWRNMRVTAIWSRWRSPSVFQNTFSGSRNDFKVSISSLHTLATVFSHKTLLLGFLIFCPPHVCKCKDTTFETPLNILKLWPQL